MAAYVSFYEFIIKDSELIGRLGSGHASEIIDRTVADPSIRICLQEPSEELISFRARCGIAEMTPLGPVPIPRNDETEQRGAWIRLLPTGSRVWAMLKNIWQKNPHDRAIEAGIRTGWIEIEGNTLKDADLTSARHALVETKLSRPEDRVFVRFSGTPEQIKQALSLLSEALP